MDARSEPTMRCPGDMAHHITSNGANTSSCGIQRSGSRSRKKVDIILIDMVNQCVSHTQFRSAQAYSNQGSDVDTVMVDGKIIMEKEGNKDFRCGK